MKSAIQPAAHADDIPIPVFKESALSDTEPSEHHEGTSYASDMNQEENFLAISNQPQLFDQKDLNDLIRDLNLSKESSEVLNSQLKAKNVLDKDTKVNFRKRDAKFIPLFSQTLELVYCSNTKDVLLMLGRDEYDPNSWKLFINSSKWSLKYVLLHNSNRHAFILIGRSTTLKEKYEPIKQVME